MMEHCSRMGFLRFDSLPAIFRIYIAAGKACGPMQLLRNQRIRDSLVTAIKGLPEREQYIMSMYYEQDMNLKEIAAVLGITESRVCQLHSQSIARLRAKMRSH